MSAKEALERVTSKDTFFDFVTALRNDCGNVTWQNGDIDTFLDAMQAWGTATSTVTGKPTVSSNPAWKAFAEILYAGAFYE